MTSKKKAQEPPMMSNKKRTKQQSPLPEEPVKCTLKLEQMNLPLFSFLFHSKRKENKIS